MLGSAIVPGGIAADAPRMVTITLVLVGTAMFVTGAMLTAAPRRWAEVQYTRNGRPEADQVEFRRFYREHRERLTAFAALMCGSDDRANALVREAAARTQLTWGRGSSSEPLVATLKVLLKGLQHPAVWLMITGEPRR